MPRGAIQEHLQVKKHLIATSENCTANDCCSVGCQEPASPGKRKQPGLQSSGLCSGLRLLGATHLLLSTFGMLSPSRCRMALKPLPMQLSVPVSTVKLLSSSQSLRQVLMSSSPVGALTVSPKCTADLHNNCIAGWLAVQKLLQAI